MDYNFWDDRTHELDINPCKGCEDYQNGECISKGGCAAPKFTTEELKLAKKLAYENMENEETEIGFEFEGTWVTNPFMETTGRFEFCSLKGMCDYYGKENVYAFLNKILAQ